MYSTPERISGIRTKCAHYLLPLLLTAPGLSSAIVIRHDIPEEQYILENTPDFLVDLPMDGHGVLIHPQWVVTVAHAICHDFRGESIKVAGQDNKIVDVIIHPDYREPDKNLFSGDSEPLGQFLLARSDIALIKLANPVQRTEPIPVFAGSDEQGKEVEIIGKGATGDGRVGEKLDTKAHRVLRHCHNIITTADGNWLSYEFDKPSSALPLEGMSGSGDSGGPTIIYVNGKPFLAGLTSWQYWKGDLSGFKGGLYGARDYQVRVSSYVQWIDSTINGAQ